MYLYTWASDETEEYTSDSIYYYYGEVLLEEVRILQREDEVDTAHRCARGECLAAGPQRKFIIQKYKNLQRHTREELSSMHPVDILNNPDAWPMDVEDQM